MKRLLFLFMSVFIASQAYGQRPILPLSYSSTGIPLLAESLKDPNLSAKVEDDLAAEQMLEDINLHLLDLKTAKALHRTELLHKTYQSYQSMAYFMDDIIAGRASSTLPANTVIRKSRAYRQSANKYANMLVRYSKNRFQRGAAFYHIYTNRYILGIQKGPAVRSLVKLKAHLRTPLKNRTDFLNGVHSLEYRNSAKGLRLISRSIKKLPRRASIAGRLVIAKNQAGLNSRGRRVRGVAKQYRTYLSSAAYRARSLGYKEKLKVFPYIIAIWRGAEGNRASWDNYPFKMSHFSKLPQAMAMIERSALTLAKKGQVKSAIRKYDYLASQASNDSIKSQLDLRILQLYEKLYSHHKTGIATQRIYITYERKFSAENNARIYKAIRAKHRSLMLRHLNKARKRSSTINIRNAAITVAERYLEGSNSEQEQIEIKSQIAHLHFLNKRYKESVRIYIALKDQTQGRKSLAFLSKAMTSQSILARWPKAVPWNGIRKSQTESRAFLLAMYEERQKMQPSWSHIGHIGFLLINAGRNNEALDLWTNTLFQSPKGFHAQRAAGFMAIAYQRSKQWQKLEDLARLCLNKRITPRYKKVRLSAYSLLGDALFFGGKEKFLNQQWAVSLKKLNEFIASYRKDRRRPEAYFITAQAYHNSAEHPKSIEALMALVGEYPRSKFEPQALLFGGEWSMPMAYEEQTIFFYQRFIDLYSRDRRVLSIRPQLSSLYLGRQLYGNAVRIYQEVSQDQRVSKTERLEAALNIMDIEERFGEVKHARWGANQARKLAGSNQEAISRVLSFETRQAAKRKDYKILRKLERRLVSFDTTSPIVRESIAQSRYLIAKKESLKTKATFFNLELRDPQKIIDQQTALFVKVKKLFDHVCDIGPSSFCAPAMLDLAETTKNTLNAIEDITIPQTLAESEVKHFEEKKLQLVAYLDQTAIEADSHALGITEEGNTTPDWFRAVEWVSGSDEGISSDETRQSGNSYIQWQPVEESNIEQVNFGADLGGVE